MYRCDDCCELFEEPTIKKDMVTDDPYPMYQDIGVCPHCGSTDYSFVEECEECGCYVEPDEMLEVEDAQGNCKSICSDCYDENYFEMPEEED